jgi:hypothetical protein
MGSRVEAHPLSVLVVCRVHSFRYAYNILTFPLPSQQHQHHSRNSWTYRGYCPSYRQTTRFLSPHNRPRAATILRNKHLRSSWVQRLSGSATVDVLERKVCRHLTSLPTHFDFDAFEQKSPRSLLPFIFTVCCCCYPGRRSASSRDRCRIIIMNAPERYVISQKIPSRAPAHKEEEHG